MSIDLTNRPAWVEDILKKTPAEKIAACEAPIKTDYILFSAPPPRVLTPVLNPSHSSTAVDLSSSVSSSSTFSDPTASSTLETASSTVETASSTLETASSVDTNSPITNSGKREAPRGKNNRLSKRQRQNEHQILRQHELCPDIAVGKTCIKGSQCKSLHSIEDYLRTKEPDLNSHHIPECPQLKEHGFCRFGYKCRFLKSHIDAESHLTHPPPSSERFDYLLSHDTIQAIRKHQLRFPRTSAVVDRSTSVQQTTCPPSSSIVPSEGSIVPQDQVVPSATSSPNITDDLPPPTADVSSNISTDVSSNISTDVSSNISTDVSSNIPSDDPPQQTPLISPTLFPREAADVKPIDWKGKLILAPLTTIGNLPFRRICKELGADITISEMALASKILEGSPSELALLKRHKSEDIFGVQLAGRNPRQLAEAIELIESHSSTKADYFDINAGCPIDLVFKQGMGSALCGRLNQMRSILQTTSRVATVPVTIKIRMGVQTGEPNAHTYVDKLGEWGAGAFTLHGRSRQARYSMLADWDYIDRCSRLAKIPIIGNGDVYNWEDAVDHFEHTNVSALMVARGAIIKPWVFKEIKERKYWDISATERLEYVREFCEYGLSHWGSDSRGVDTTRRFALEWLSFLYRYIPVGLLEALPSRINHRVPTQFGFLGRSDLETKLASSNPIDWIEITEMFLGPAPSGYSFTPKHRAEAYTRVER